MTTPLYATKVGGFRQFGYAVTAICPCGHKRTMSAAFLMRFLGVHYEMDDAGQAAFARRLVCHKCDRRSPRLDIGKGWAPAATTRSAATRRTRPARGMASDRPAAACAAPRARARR